MPVLAVIILEMTDQKRIIKSFNRQLSVNGCERLKNIRTGQLSCFFHVQIYNVAQR